MSDTHGGRGPRIRHALIAGPNGAGPGWYVVDTRYRPERDLSGHLDDRDAAAAFLAAYLRGWRPAVNAKGIVATPRPTEPTRSPFTRRALAGQLPAAELTR